MLRSRSKPFAERLLDRSGIPVTQLGPTFFIRRGQRSLNSDTSLGYEIQTSSFKRHTFDTLIIAGSIAAPAATPGLLNYLRSAVHRTARIASVCTGALVPAEAGLLDGRRATTRPIYSP